MIELIFELTPFASYYAVSILHTIRHTGSIIQVQSTVAGLLHACAHRHSDQAIDSEKNSIRAQENSRNPYSSHTSPSTLTQKLRVFKFRRGTNRRNSYIAAHRTESQKTKNATNESILHSSKKVTKITRQRKHTESRF